MTASIDLFALNGVEATLGSASTIPEPLRYRAANPAPRPLSPATFEPYTVQRITIAGARRHPTALVESAALASVVPPMPKRAKPLLEPNLISSGALSLEQLEAVIYASEQHERWFSLEETVHTLVREQDPERFASPIERNGSETIATTYRHGFFLGDGTGTGKGRTVAAIIRAAMHAGEGFAVWLSANERLIDDARRDWVALGGTPEDIQPWSRWPLGTPPGNGFRMLFGSYDTLGYARKGRRRLDDLIARLGADFSGIIIADEVHACANAHPSQSTSEGRRQPSRRGIAALTLQRRLPKARFVYVSATGASRLDGLSYAHRLGLWAQGSGFQSRVDFLLSLDSGGTAALESLARDLKAKGQFCSRHLSYEGVDYERIVCELDDEQIDLFNRCVALVQLIERGISREMILLGAAALPEPGQMEAEQPKGSPLGYLRASMTATWQRFFGQLYASLKLPTIVRRVRAALELGQAPVCGLTHTGEADLVEALTHAGDDLDHLDVSHRQLLIDFVTTHYPVVAHKQVWRYNESTKENEPVIEPIADEEGNPQIDPAALDRRQALIEAIHQQLLPDGVLDQLHAAFPGMIAEVTGRRQMLVPSVQPDGTIRRELVTRGKHASREAIADFNEGRKPILVFSERFGGIGASYHASTQFANQGRRVYLPLEFAWSAEGVLQMLGRVHRTGQIVPPIIVFTTTSLPGEKRLTSTPARRLANLGALSRGQREAADNGLFRAEDCLEGPYAEEALRRMLSDVTLEKIPQLDRRTLYAELGIDSGRTTIVPHGTSWLDKRKHNRTHQRIRMTRFLNRLMATSTGPDGGIQQRIMDAFLERLEGVIDEAIAAERYDAGVHTFRPKHLRIASRETLNVDPSGARTELLRLEIEELPFARISWSKACSARDVHLHRNPCHAPSFTLDAGEIALHLPLPSWDPTLAALVRVLRPHGESTRLASNEHTFERLDDERAEAAWADAYEHVDLIRRDLWVVAGALTTVWKRLPAFKAIYRMQTDDGEPLLGRLVYHDDIAMTRDRFGMTTPASAA